MRVAVAIEVTGMTISAGTTPAAIERSVTMSARSNNPRAVDTGVTVKALVLMNNANRVAYVTVNTKGCSGNG